MLFKSILYVCLSLGKTDTHTHTHTLSFQQLMAKLGTCRKAKAKVPVIIGSLPLQTTYSSFLPPNGGTTVATSTSHPFAPPPHSPSTSSHPASAPSMEPYSGPPPPYNASFLPPQYCDVREYCGVL